MTADKLTLNWHPSITVSKFEPETIADITARLGHYPTHEELLAITPDDVTRSEGNSLVTAGLSRITSLITGSGQAFVAGKALIGVGTGPAATATTAGMTDLTGASKLFVPATVGAPSGGQFSASASFDGNDANFSWEEWCFAIGSGTVVKNAALATAGGGSAVMLNRKNGLLGSKALGAVWTLSADVTLS